MAVLRSKKIIAGAALLVLVAAVFFTVTRPRAAAPDADAVAAAGTAKTITVYKSPT